MTVEEVDVTPDPDDPLDAVDRHRLHRPGDQRPAQPGLSRSTRSRDGALRASMTLPVPNLDDRALPGPRRRGEADGPATLSRVDRPQRLRPGRHAHRDVRVDDRHAALPPQPGARPSLRQVPRAHRREAVPPHAARAEISFRLSSHHDDVVRIAAGTAVSTRRTVSQEAIGFSTVRGLDIPPSPSRTVVTVTTTGTPGTELGCSAWETAPGVQCDPGGGRRALTRPGPACPLVAACWSRPSAPWVGGHGSIPTHPAAGVGGVHAVRLGGVRRGTGRHPRPERVRWNRAPRPSRSRRVESSVASRPPGCAAAW